MKILFIHNRYQFQGGEDTALDAQIELLSERGHEVKVVRFDNKKISKNGFPLADGFNAVYNVSSGKHIKDEIDLFKPDVIHIHNIFFLASPSVLYAAHKSRVPVIFTLHNYRLICCNALLLRNHTVCELCTKKTLPLSGIKYKCYRSSHVQSALVTGITSLHKMVGTWKSKVDTYISLTEFGKAKLLDSSLRLPAEQLVVLANFVADPDVDNLPRQKFFLYVGRISPEKGLPVLLDCFASMPDQALVIVGDGPDKTDLENQYKGFPNIRFYGQQSKADVFKLMHQAQAFIFPSIWYEGLPFTIIEAFSVGTPVIASRLGAMAEIVEDGFNGFHFEPGNVQDLARVVTRFADSGEEKQKIYEQAKHTYKEKYHPDVYYKSIMSIYNKAIKSKSLLQE